MGRMRGIDGREYTERLSQRVGGEQPVYKLGTQDPLFSHHEGFTTARARLQALRQVIQDAESPELVEQAQEIRRFPHWRFIYFRRTGAFLTEQPTPANNYLDLFVQWCVGAPQQRSRCLSPTPSHRPVISQASLRSRDGRGARVRQGMVRVPTPTTPRSMNSSRLDCRGAC